MDNLFKTTMQAVLDDIARYESDTGKQFKTAHKWKKDKKVACYSCAVMPADLRVKNID